MLDAETGVPRVSETETGLEQTHRLSDRSRARFASLRYPGVFYWIAPIEFMDITITQQPLLVWIWVISTFLTIVDEQMGIGRVGDIALLVFLGGVVYFLIVIAVRLK
jgi:hypothetical protein